jgi:CBS-domain-containing membrane protein
VMTRSVITARPETPLSDLASLLEKHRIKRVPVVQNGEIVGIVSRANLIQSLVRRGESMPPEPPIKDSTIRDNVLAALRSKPWWPSDIHIAVRDGAVELWGLVETNAQMEAIRVAVELTPGVRAIENNLGMRGRPTAQ